MKFTPDLSPMSTTKVAARIEALRHATGLGASLFADEIGIDRSSYTKIAKGTKPLKAEMGFAVAVRWGVSMDYLYKGDLSNLPSKYESAIISHLNNAAA